MTEKESLHGLACPRCGGVVPIPEGQVIVRCPYCDLRSFVSGERGLLRYQVAQRVQREDALEALRKFLSGNQAIARGAARNSTITEAFLVFLPFWTVWARVAAWVFGEKRVGSGDKQRYEPREVRVVQEMTWNGAACDVGEFGVNQIPQIDQSLEPFNSDTLHNSGLVFEPVGSFSDASAAADSQFNGQVQRKAGLDRVSQFFLRTLRRRSALVYYPLWVLRYNFRERAYQAVVDGSMGKVLYGKAPGNTLYRAAVLVLGMAAGAFIGIDIPAFLLSQLSDDGSGIFGFAMLMLAAGIGLMIVAYRAFRRGEYYEYRMSGRRKFAGLDNPLQEIIQIKDVEFAGLDIPLKEIIQMKDIKGWKGD